MSALIFTVYVLNIIRFLQHFGDVCSIFIYIFLYSGSRILFCHVFDALSIHPKYLQFDDEPNAVELFSEELPHSFCYLWA